MDEARPDAQAHHLLELLEDLLGQNAISLDDAMGQAAHRIGEVFRADKVDVFLYDEAPDALVAVGTSRTPMGRRQRELGLDRLPIAGGGWTIEVFQSGQSHLSRRADRESGETAGVVQDLGVSSSMNVPLEVAGERRGVLLVASATPKFFTEDDLIFVETVARWVGLAADRAAHVQCLVEAAVREATARAAEEAVSALTTRQQEVAGLIADGLSNEQIARRLLITPGTTANHVEHILRRLNLGSRVQIATWATRYGLSAP